MSRFARKACRAVVPGSMEHCPSASSSRLLSTTTAVGNRPQVRLAHLPPTTTHNDIRDLCYRPAYVGLSAAHQKGNSTGRGENQSPSEFSHDRSAVDPVGMLRDIASIRILRSSFLNPRGVAVVTFNNKRHAENFAETAKGRLLSGHLVQARYFPNASDVSSDVGDENTVNVRLLRLLQETSPGRVVMLKGLPMGLQESRLERMLSHSYNLSRSEILVPSSSEVGKRPADVSSPSKVGSIVRLRSLTPISATSSFLVRLESVSDAMRLVNRWHRRPWKNTGRINQPKEQYIDGIDGEESIVDNEQGRDDPDRVQMEENLRLIPFVIDAYIMY